MIRLDSLDDQKSPGLRMLAHVHQKPSSKTRVSDSLSKLFISRLPRRGDAQALVEGDRLQAVEEVFHVPLAA